MQNLGDILGVFLTNIVLFCYKRVEIRENSSLRSLFLLLKDIDRAYQFPGKTTPRDLEGQTRIPFQKLKLFLLFRSLTLCKKAL